MILNNNTDNSVPEDPTKKFDDYQSYESKNWNQFNTLEGTNYVEVKTDVGNVNVYVKTDCATADGKYDPKTIGVIFPEAGGFESKDAISRSEPTIKNAAIQAMKNDKMPDVVVAANRSSVSVEGTSGSVKEVFTAMTEVCGDNYKSANIGVNGSSKGVDPAMEFISYTIDKNPNNKMNITGVMDDPVNHGQMILGSFKTEKQKEICSTIGDKAKIFISVPAGNEKSQTPPLVSAQRGAERLAKHGLSAPHLLVDGKSVSNYDHMKVDYNSISDGALNFATGKKSDFLSNNREIYTHTDDGWGKEDPSKVKPNLEADFNTEEISLEKEEKTEEVKSVPGSVEMTGGPGFKEEEKMNIETEEVIKELEVKGSVEITGGPGSTKNETIQSTPAADGSIINPVGAAGVAVAATAGVAAGATTDDSKEESTSNKKDTKDSIKTSDKEDVSVKDDTTVENTSAKSKTTVKIDDTDTDTYLLGLAKELKLGDDYAITDDSRFVYSSMQEIKSAAKSVSIPAIVASFASTTKVPAENLAILKGIADSTRELLDKIAQETENIVKIALAYDKLDAETLDKILNIPTLDQFNTAFGLTKEEKTKKPRKTGGTPPSEKPTGDEGSTGGKPEEGTTTTPEGETTTPEGETTTPSEEHTDEVVGPETETPSGEGGSSQEGTTPSGAATPIKDGKGGNKVTKKKTSSKKSTKKSTKTETPAPVTGDNSVVDYDDYDYSNDFGDFDDFEDYNDDIITDTPSVSPTPSVKEEKKSGIPWGTIGGVAAAGLAAGGVALGIHAATSKDKDSPYQYEDKNYSGGYNPDDGVQTPGEPDEVDHYDVPLEDQYKVQEENTPSTEGGEL